MEVNAVVLSLAALAQPTRLQVFRALVVAGAQGVTPGALAEQLGVAPASPSFNLKALVPADLVALSFSLIP